MNYLCPHGYLRADCNMCVKIAELMEENMGVPQDDTVEEYLYDYYLDQDERLLREQEESA